MADSRYVTLGESFFSHNKNVQQIAFLKRIRDFCEDLIFPAYCVNCKKLGNFLCENCYHGLEFYWESLDLDRIERSLGELYFDQVLIMAKLDQKMAKLIKMMKYQSAANIAPFLGKMLYQHLQIPQADLITYVPLHKKKLRIRGFNQCQLVAQELANLTKIEQKNILERTKNSQAQASVKKQSERIQRMENVFKIRKKYENFVKNKKVILLDDIFTTGSTINAAAKVLKNAGASEIITVIIASKK